MGLGDLLTSELGVTVVALGTADIQGELHVVLCQDQVTDTGGFRCLHTIRHTDGTWEALRNVDAEVAPKGISFDQLSCANVAGQLHVCGVRDNRTLLHTIRYPDGHWQNYWGDVLAAVQAPPVEYGNEISVDCAGNDAGELQVVFLTGFSGARLQAFHAIRGADGNWTTATPFDHFKILEENL